MAKGFHDLQWYDEEVWNLLIKDISTKKKLNNLEFFQTFNKSLTEMNVDPLNPFFQKLDSTLKVLKDKHYTEDRQWRFNLEENRMRSW